MQSQTSRKISVVIPTWQRGDLLRRCLNSLREQTLADFETIVVSNGAGEWVDRLAEEYHCSVIHFPENRGFAAAVNAGIAASKSPYVAVLNDDVALSKNWLALTSACLEERLDVSSCCGKIYDSDGKWLDDAGDAVSMGGSAWRLGFGRRDAEEFGIPRHVNAVPGTAALFRRSVFEQAGVFDEQFFSYLEDIDFSLRASRAGCKGYYLPQATCRHQGSATSGGATSPMVFRFLTRNQLLLLAKNFPASLLLRLSPRIAWAQLLWALMAFRKRLVLPYVQGLAGFLRCLPSLIVRRPAWEREERQKLLALLRESERQIYQDVTAPDRKEVDLFWRLYFLLFPPGKENKASAKAGLGRLPAR